MGFNNRCSLTTCSCLNLFISLLMGVAFGLLLFFGIVTNVLLTTYIVLGFAFLVLIFILIGAYLSTNCNYRHLSICTRRKFPCLLIGTFGTIITSLLIIAFDFTILIPLVVFFAILAFFVSLMIISLISFILCILCTTSTETV